MGQRYTFVRERLTPERKEAFKSALRASGSRTWSAKQASPLSRGNPLRTFTDEMERDDLFREECEAALAEAHDAIRHEIRRRAMDGVLTPVFQKGMRAVDSDGSPASIRVFSDRLLELAARVLPELTQKSIVDSNINVHVQNAEPAYRITKRDIYFLSPSERKSLASIVLAISKSRGDVEDTNLIEAVPLPQPVNRDPWEDNFEDSENE